MAAIDVALVKQLREKSGAGILDCKEALSGCEGNIIKAVEYLRKKGLATAQKRAGRTTGEGIIQAYIHMGGKIGVLVEINCETDFVAMTDDFKAFVKNIAMHIAATNPISVASEDVPAEVIDKEKEIYRAQALEMGKPEKIIGKIAEGKLNKFYKDNCLLLQPYVRDPDVTIEDVLNDIIGKTGEKITIKRFARFQIGES